MTAEGFLDEQSFEGKVVGGVADLAAACGVPCVAIVGEVVEGLDLGALAPTAGLEVVSLVERFGGERARADTVACIEEVTGGLLARNARPDEAVG